MAEADKPSNNASPNFGSFEDVLKLTMELSRDPNMAPIAESVANTLLAVIGSGPSFAAMQSLVAANQANGLMYHNAVANQQMTNIMGMVATMNCVQVLLDKPADVPWPTMPGQPDEDHDHGR